MSRVEPPPPFDNSIEYRLLLDRLKGWSIPFMELEETDYPYWEKWKYKAKEWGLDPVNVWATVKRHRDPPRWIKFEGLIKPQLNFNTPSFIQEYLYKLDLSLGGSLQSAGLIPAEEKHRYLVSSLMEEAIASSQLEGAATTRKIAKEMLENNVKPRNSSEQMIANNYEAMQWIVRSKEENITRERILELHRIITQHTLSSRELEGEFRTTSDIRVIDTRTGDVLHEPPSYEEIEKLIQQFCLFANDRNKDELFLHPILKAIILHFLIGFVHPFADGNGRTARAVFYWYLIRKGYWLVEYMSISRVILRSKAQYARAYQYTELDQNDLTYFLDYNLRSISKALDELKKYIARKNEERNNTLMLLKNTMYNDRQIGVIREILSGDKNSFTVPSLETAYQVSNQTARNDLNKLVDDGILEPRTTGKRIYYILTAEGMERIRKMGGA